MKTKTIKAWAAIDKYGDLLTHTISYFRANAEKIASCTDFASEVLPVEINILPPRKPKKQ